MKYEYYSCLRFLIRNKIVNKMLRNKKIFFIFAQGRSGTNFLANLLNKSPNALVVHEPVGNDFRAYKQAYYNENEAYKYIENFRKIEIYHRIKKEKFKIYGEVNGVLRRHCKELMNSFPNDTMFYHLTRDGRDVVRSIYSRRTFDDLNNTIITPKEEDPYKDTWDIMTKFQRICWYWEIENEYLYNIFSETIDINKIIKFEKIVSDYNYLKEKLLDPIGLDISKEIWEGEIHKPKNITIEYKLPHWKNWSDEKTTIFNDICGETMRKLGYI